MTTTRTERELRNLRFQKTGIRRDLLSLSNATDTLTTQEPVLHDDLLGNLSSIDNLMNKMEDLDTQIVYALDTEEEVLTDMKDSEDIKQATRRLTAKVIRILASLTSFDPSPRHSVTTIAQSPVAAMPFSGRQFAKLPQLQLPHFNGDPLQWTPFWDSFESSVHSSTMPGVDKFNYLKSFLRGTASDAIAGISVTNNNYDTAVTLIKQRFGQRQIIINAHVESLISISKSTNETGSLRKMFDAIEVHVRGLEVLGITAAINGAIMTPIILSKLPSDIRLILTRKHGTAVGDLDVLRELLKAEIEARELSEIKTNPEVPASIATDFTTGALFSQATPYSCVFCKGSNHMSYACTLFVSPSSRKAQLQKERRCFNCLRQGHTVDQCFSHDQCRHCHVRHHSSICFRQHDMNQLSNAPSAGYPRRFPGPPPSPQRTHGSPAPRNFVDKNPRTTPNRRPGPRSVNTSTVIDNFDPDYSHVAQHSNTSFAPTSVLMSTSNSVIMQTALVNVPDSCNTQHTVRLLFDTGSQRSYATSTLIQRLGLKPSGSETLAIAPFGQSRSANKSYEVAEINCNSRYSRDSHTISVVIVPQITQPLFRAPYSASLQSATCIVHLADPPTDKGQWLVIDVLVGLDYYWQIVKDNTIRIPDTYFTAVPSSFGYLISGTRDSKSSSKHSSDLFIASAANSDEFLKEF